MFCSFCCEKPNGFCTGRIYVKIADEEPKQPEMMMCSRVSEAKTIVLKK